MSGTARLQGLLAPAGSLQPTTLAEEAAEALRRAILLERLSPGAPISEREVAEALAISRTPLRQALAILEQEGLIEYSASRRPRVADPTLAELGHALTVLGALEALAGELACEAASERDIREVTRLCQAMAEGSDSLDPLEFFEIDMEFHRTIVLASANPALIATHRQYNARLWRARFISSRRRPDRAGTLRQHDEIATTFTARDATGCAQALRTHLATTHTNIAKALAERSATQPEVPRP
ncbi:MAG: GntR family transcriptional regulator [Pseudomonadota bacterium]